MDLKDKTCLITGSSVRVGREIALTLAQKGAKIAIHYLSNEEKANDIINQIHNFGGDALAVKGDISKKSDWIRMKNLVIHKWNSIDILVNNAAIFYKTPFFKISNKDWTQFLNVNLIGTFYGCQIIGDFMYKKKQGKIINIADVAAENIWPSYIPYCVSKAGVIALTKGIAKALAPYVTVNAISPGTVLLAEKYDEEEEISLINRTPLRRIGDPKDIANTVAFLIEGSDFINGEIIKVDGGRSLT
jgi:NAD(P)-dependent dehydrogenase (short-subunit alcohol dehydrogenase family)